MMAKIIYNNRLRVLLAEQCMTNRALAERLNVSEISVSRWVTNKTQPSMQQFIEIAKILNVKIDDLLEPYNIV
jgi:transcriptional regulator with XRE-family HTH domain